MGQPTFRKPGIVFEGERMSQEQAGQNEQRRFDVDRLLKKATDEKVLWGSSDEAYQHAQKAYDLATQEPRIVEPLPAKAAYRLAHLMLRKRCDHSELREVARLFKEATQLEPVRALAHIYRTAALQRLFVLRADPALERQIAESWQCAAEAVDAAPEEDDRSGGQPVRLQEWTFNMLELSAYFTGQPYKPLIGHGGRLDLALERNDWLIVGPESITKKVKYPRSLALQELNERAKRAEGHEVFFKLGTDEQKWKRAGGEYENAPEHALQILSHLLFHDRTKDQLMSRIVARGILDPPGQMRTNKKRLKDGLGKLLGCQPTEVYEEDRDGVLHLSGEFVVYGAVQVNFLFR